ncbi:calcium:proton antiporter [Paraburkholderia tropica]|uniref:calcium:proton antiporter n=1 Tax=Paraburkholderia tropica TaxID=92647 RepID=UPI002AB769B4|nr:ionic transporter y4hA [Paraburkholderia tropica]
MRQLRQPPSKWFACVTFIAVIVVFSARWTGLTRQTIPVLAVILVAAVLAAVHHAQHVASRVGPILGTLVLALSVTAVEAGFIISVIASANQVHLTLARDTVFSSLMLCCNGMLGLSLLVSTRREQTLKFDAFISGAAFATVATVATLTMVLPTFTRSSPGPQFNAAQLTFASTAAVVLYVLHAFKSTHWLHEYVGNEHRPGAQAAVTRQPSGLQALLSLGLLLVSLLAVIYGGEALAPFVEDAMRKANLPTSSVGVLIAMVVALPETLTAVKAAHAGQVQVSFNLALGSAMASLGLTIPVVAITSGLLHFPLTLGLGPKEMVLLALTTVVGILTVVPGRASVMRGSLHLTICAAYVFLALVP